MNKFAFSQRTMSQNKSDVLKQKRTSYKFKQSSKAKITTKTSPGETDW